MMRFGVVVLLFLVSQLIHSQSIVGFEIERFAEESEVIVEGEVLKKIGFYHDNGLIYTRYTFKVSGYFKNGEFSPEIDFIQVGGVVGDEALVVCPSIKLNIGQTGIIGLRSLASRSGEDLIPVSGMQSWIDYDEEEQIYVLWSGESFKKQELIESIESHTKSEYQLVDRDEKQINTPESAVVINSITPLTTQAGRGREITINGSGFGSSRGSGGVFFRNVNAGSSSYSINGIIYNQWTSTQIKVIVPYNAGSGKIVVETDAGMISSPSAQDLTITYNVINVSLTELTYLIDFDNFNNGGYAFKYSDNTANGGVDFTSIPDAISAVERATSTWNSGTGFSIYTEEACGTTSLQVPSRDGTNLLTFDSDAYDMDVQFGSSTLGVMFSYYSKCGSSEWEVMEMDMVLRRDGDPNGFGGSVNWEYGPGSPTLSETDFESVVLHEFGHAHQLGHCRISGAVMQPFIVRGTTNRNLSSSETNGGNFCQNESTAYNPPVIGGCPPPFNQARQYEDYDASNKCSGFLPLELVQFSVNKRGKSSANVFWLTNAERFHSKTELEYLHEEGGSSWMVLESFPHSDDNDVINEYEFVHEGLTVGVHLYRLKFIDHHGNYEYSELRSLEIEGESRYVMAQLNGSQIPLTWKFPNDDSFYIGLYDLSGKMLYRTKWSEVPLSIDLDQSVPILSSGVYILSWWSDRHKVPSLRKIMVD
ncbi:MAG: matrixin family metalloprotease [Saprospiraceae bacterium]|nr:matrixin family metalloprotease [Saprospiraceae bacterium]